MKHREREREKDEREKKNQRERVKKEGGQRARVNLHKKIRVGPISLATLLEPDSLILRYLSLLPEKTNRQTDRQLLIMTSVLGHHLTLKVLVLSYSSLVSIFNGGITLHNAGEQKLFVVSHPLA